MHGQWFNDKHKHKMGPSQIVSFRLFSGDGVGWHRSEKLRVAQREIDNYRTLIVSRFTVLAEPEMGIDFNKMRRGEPRRGANGIL